MEAEIEILKHEISVLKAMCKDLRYTMHVQDNVKKIEAAKKTSWRANQRLWNHKNRRFVPQDQTTKNTVGQKNPDRLVILQLRGRNACFASRNSWLVSGV